MTWMFDADEEDFKMKSEIRVKNPFSIPSITLAENELSFGQDIELNLNFTKGPGSYYTIIRANHQSEALYMNQSEPEKKLLEIIQSMFTVASSMPM